MQDVLPALAEQGVTLHQSVDDLPPADRAHLDAYFHANVFPVLTPLAVDPGHPFPYISNLSLSLAVVLRGADGEERFARVKVPKILPRWVPLPTPNHFVPLEQVIGANLESLFPGVEILGWYTFRITRNTDLADRPRRRGRGPAQPDPGRGPEPALRRGGAPRGACRRCRRRSASCCWSSSASSRIRRRRPLTARRRVRGRAACWTPPTC